MPPPSTSNEKTALPEQTAIDVDDHRVEDVVLARKITGLKWAVVVLAIISSTFLYALDNTIMANIRPGIIKSLGHIELLPWITVAYPLGEFNNKWLYITAVFLFEVGSAISGAAPTMSVLVFGRVLAGVGGSGIYVGTVNILTIMTAPVERAQYLGFVGMAWSLGTILGPMIGGAFNDSKATWRWAFYINLCAAALAAPAWLLLIPSSSPRAGVKRLEKVKQLDFLGITLFAGGVASIILILGFGGTIWEYSSARMVGLYVALGLVWVAFICQQWLRIFTISPIFPIHFFANVELVIMFLQTAIAISDILVTIYMLPLFFQFVYGDSTLRSGVYVLAVTAAGIAAAGGGGAVFPKFPLYMVWFVAANAFIIIGAALLTTISDTSSRGTVCGFAIINLIGGGLIVQLSFTVGQVKAGPRDVRPVNTFLTTAQMFGLAVSLGVATALFVNIAVPELSLLMPDRTKDAVYAAVEGVGNASFDELSDIVRGEILRVVAKSVAKVFYLNVAGGAWGFVTALALKRERLAL
ncbi:MFS general substrate transporter [Trematosphaeria pertusa]|uniref:MFS general substrate transporter n=1 Tax=Trematosphaeria pertusa TaxID=390896 RepID=A0A6A6IVC3_9PLEO|nr:MFS general substrate transporter [Trematosphaeria pertusa]KAF2253862.1 MFS general substrate transporter [Trematosphaeria pertusa]